MTFKYEHWPAILGVTSSVFTLALASPLALAQKQEIEEVVVTGTRLPKAGFDAPTPVAVIGEEEFVLSGTMNIETLLTDSPQFTANQLDGPKANTVQAGAPVGVSTLNLRNFGPTRNLVLVNGRRGAITGPGMTTDINTIPVALIKRTEIVTGGSSAVYGSDAIAGVVNFILKDHYEGFEINAQSSWDEPTGTAAYNFDLTFGGNFDNDRGNLTASIGYLDRGGFTREERGDFANPSFGDGCVTAESYSSNRLGVALEVPAGQTCEEAGGRLGFVGGGSSTPPNGRIGNLPLVGSPASDAALDAALIAAGLQDMTSLGAIFDAQGNTVRPFISPDDRFDLGPNSFMVTPQERWMSNLFGSYSFNDKMTGYLEAHYSNNNANVQIAPTNVTGNFLVETDNPYLSQEMQDILTQLDSRETGTTTITQGSLSLDTTPNDGLAILNYNRRFNDLQTRYADADHQVFRAVFGLRGKLGNTEGVFRDLAYDVYFSTARTTEVDVQIGSVSKSAVQRSMLSQNSKPPILNLFGNGNISAEAAAAIGISSVSKIQAELEVAVASLTGVAFDMPAGPVDFAVGYESRRANAKYIPDSYLSSGDVSGWNSARPTSGSQSVTEYFGEFRLPILGDLPGFERLNLNGAFRYSDYDVGADKGVWTYSSGLEWAVNSELSFRGQFQHAIRAPNVGELFGGQGSDGPMATDPCSANLPVAEQTQAVRDTCIATGVPADAVFTAGVQPAPFLNQIRGGNPELNPEKSDTTTFGIVYESAWIEGFGLTVDYFNIELEDAIAPLGGGGIQNVLDLCYKTLQDPNSVYCKAVNRDPVSGEIAPPKYVYTTNANIGGIKTSGVDFVLRYGFDSQWGLFGNPSNWEISTAQTYTDEFTVTPIQELPELTNECVGAWGGTCGQPIPKWKSTTRFSWFTGNTTLSLRVRYIDSITTDRIVVPKARGESYPPESAFVNAKIDPYFYLDFTGAYSLTDNTQLTLGLSNLLDKEPPVLGSLQQGGSNTIPATYDVQGRVLFAGIKMQF